MILFCNCFSENETPEESQARKGKKNEHRRNKWAEYSTREKRERTAKSNANREIKRIAEDEVSAANRRRVEANQKMNQRTLK